MVGMITKNIDLWFYERTPQELTKAQCEQLEIACEQVFGEEYKGDICVDMDQVDDLLMFDKDGIADMLGFKNWEALLNYNRFGENIVVNVDNIEWDTEGYEPDEIPELPTTIQYNDMEYNGDDEALYDRIDCYLANTYDFYIIKFDFKIQEG